MRVPKHRFRIIQIIAFAVLSAVLLSGCGLIGALVGADEVPPTPTNEPRVLVPTFTPTAVGQAPTPVPPAAQPAEPIAPPTDTPTPEPQVTDTPTPEPQARVFVNIAVANVRTGPGVEYGLAGSVNQGQELEVLGKNPEGTWWQVCCVNGQQVWIFGEIVRAENTDAVAVAQSLPAPPPTQPAPPTNTPAPAQPTQPPAPAAANAGPCGGDDGCKFRITGGPDKYNNNGVELKFRLYFIHSGVDGGQPQGDYRLGIEKDGQLIGAFANQTSIRLTTNRDPRGDYNYEARVGLGEIPGGAVAGTYFFWVLDGNRERDSEVFRLDLSPQEGEIWIRFDQG